MALTFNLFVDAGIIPPESVNKRYDFLIDASSAIVSSLHTSNPDIGVQLAVRLLAPYATKTQEVTAAIANILEHYTPSTDLYARTVLSLCTPILSKLSPKNSRQDTNSRYQKQILLMDGCVSILIQLYKKYTRQSTIPSVNMTQFLLEGVDIESEILSQPWLGTSYQMLESECYKAAFAALYAMDPSATIPKTDKECSQQQQDLESYLVKIEPMADAIEQYMSSTRNVSGIAKLLVRVAALFLLFLAEKDYQKQANHIIELLSLCERHFLWIKLRWRILRVAYGLQPHTTDDGLFDRDGVTELLRHWSALTSYVEMCSIGDDDDQQAKQELFGMGLHFQSLILVAICTQNASVQNNQCSGEADRNEHYSTKSAEEKKQFVADMLDGW
jgi:hypothetical protein